MKELQDYDFPSDLKSMTDEELELLAVKIREFLISKVSKTGGHLASNLGVVELTIALHKVFDSPKDKMVWDVGHQSYVHKILTGRAGAFDGLRKTGGISGFPKRCESEHDVYETGHASTSLSAAGGIANARDLKGEDYNVVSIIGDGSLTGGMAYEALNNIGSSGSKVIVILNDNGMSISKNIGGVSDHLGKLRTSSGYTRAKASVRRAISKVPIIGRGVAGGISGVKDIVKYALLSGGIFFEDLGFTYLGPVDGHDIGKLTDILETAKLAGRSVLVHVMTKKGKGYRNAEDAPNKFHGIGPFDPATGAELTPPKLSFSKVMGQKLLELAENDSRICAITAAMGTATGLGPFSEQYPERYFDVGIAEEHAVTFAAGLAVNGMRPLVAIYSSFLQRSYDQIIEDVALQSLPVVFAVDRAGIVGADGETHQGIFDLAYLSTVPGLTIYTPADASQLRKMLDLAFDADSPVAVRYPRGAAREGDEAQEFSGNGIRFSKGKDADIFAVGPMIDTALEAAAELSSFGIDAGVFDVTKVKPIEDSVFDGAKRIFTLEDGITSGGFGEHLMAAAPEGVRVVPIGFPDAFIEHGSPDDLYRKYGLDAGSVAETIRRAIEKR